MAKDVISRGTSKGKLASNARSRRLPPKHPASRQKKSLRAHKPGKRVR